MFWHGHGAVACLSPRGASLFASAHDEAWKASFGTAVTLATIVAALDGLLGCWKF